MKLYNKEEDIKKHSNLGILNMMKGGLEWIDCLI